MRVIEIKTLQEVREKVQERKSDSKRETPKGRDTLRERGRQRQRQSEREERERERDKERCIECKRNSQTLTLCICVRERVFSERMKFKEIDSENVWMCEREIYTHIDRLSQRERKSD